MLIGVLSFGRTRTAFSAMRSLSRPRLIGLRNMDWADYLRDQAVRYRQLAEQTDNLVIKIEMLELASVCEEVANNVEDPSHRRVTARQRGPLLHDIRVKEKYAG